MKNVMTRAWEIAKEGAVKFGGKVKEYFAQALVMAWAEVKQQSKKAVFALHPGKRGQKSWIAKVVGTDAKYGFKREFINDFDGHDMMGNKRMILDEGYYHFNGIKNKGYIKVVAGQWEIVSMDEVKGAIA